jgi:hypothetical protein
VTDYEKLGAFYLGRGYDAEARAVTDDLMMYDSRDLVTHGVVLGMTGSGKTGLCLALLEEAAMDNIPAIIIDPKGDIANLLLTFPGLTGEEFQPWVNEEDAVRKGISVTEHAAQTAAMWKQGLAQWGQGAERIQQFRDKVEVNIFTPGSKAGIAVSILSTLAVPPFEILDDGELLGERVECTVRSLLGLIGKDEAAQQQEGILLSVILQTCWQKGEDVSLETLIRSIQKPPFDKVGVVDVESFFPSKERQELALQFNHVIAAPGFAQWLEGVPLDISAMLTAPSGKPRLSIFSIAHLGDEERMFFVSLLLNQVLGWMRMQSGTTSLRALLYMDEIFGYLPPTANPPSKRPMMTLLKQSRAFGLGCLLATQNPADLDYKALSNIGTWFLGRLQTERDQMRVLDGLEGAASAQNVAFDRNAVGALLAGLENRVFLMNNVHDGEPSLFHVRWVMSYLRGPLTRKEIKTLMDPKRGTFGGGAAVAATEPKNPMSMPGMSRDVERAVARPMLGAGVEERFLAHSGEVEGLTYRPHLWRSAEVHFLHRKGGVEGSRSVSLVNPILEESIAWDEVVQVPVTSGNVLTDAASGIGFSALPGYAMNGQSYAQATEDFKEWLYRQERAEIFQYEELDAYSQWGELESEFRARLAHQVREKRDIEVQKIRAAAVQKFNAMQARLVTAEGQLARQKSEATSAKMQAGVSIITGVLGALLGGSKRGGIMGKLSKGKAVISSASGAFRQGQDVTLAEEKVATIGGEMDALHRETDEKIAFLTSSFDPVTVPLTKEVLKPTRADVDVKSVCLLWLPYDDDGKPAWN